MINIEVVISEQKLRHVKADGHAGNTGYGTDIVCAAVTTLLRTTASLLEAQKDIPIEGEAPAPGLLNVSIKKVPFDRIGWLEGVTDYFLYGLRMLEKEYPDQISLIIKQET